MRGNRFRFHPGSNATAANTGGGTMTIQPELVTVQTNGIRLRVALAGNGPLVVLVHGWPESWYSWRHQIPALVEAGYRVAAPDVRGYGGSDKPVSYTHLRAHETDSYLVC